jgi:hypothetical protein
MESPTAGDEQSPESLAIELPSWSVTTSLPLTPPQTIEDSLTNLESLLDSWQTDSLELLRELQNLRITVQALKSTLTRSERLAEGLALSLEQERSKTQSLRRWLVISISGGVVVSIVAFCLGAYSQ